MYFRIYFLLLGCPSIIMGAIFPIDLIRKDVEDSFEFEGSNITGSDEHRLKLLEDGLIGKTMNSLTWKGIYNEVAPVAIQIMWNERRYNEEMEAFIALNATEDENIEQRGIPRVYYHGSFYNRHYMIAMTLFEETLYNRFKLQNRKISELSILLIFKRAAEILGYLSENNVVHNDITPYNVFLRGSEVFISDFGASTLNGGQRSLYTKKFASVNVFKQTYRFSMDDLQSLVFTIWYIAGVPRSRHLFLGLCKPDGKVLADYIERGKAKSKILKKCAHFKDEHVRNAFATICADEMICTKKKKPDYRRIVDVLKDAIIKMHGSLETAEFEWLGTSAEPSLVSKLSFLCLGSAQ